ncbi:histidinol dehydrogenase [uncultured Alistipes sp.]|uniref:histidinol dehydrogenase n=1 Tax=uncultured Alistipes sp. TaxID=538949 RepID=UPI003209E21A
MERLTIYNNPARVEWAALTERCTRREEEITEQVAAILDEVRSGGDRALRAITQRIEGRTPDRQEVPAGELQAAEKELSPELKEALAAAKANIEAFHRAQLPGEVRTETQPGVTCLQRAVPIRRVGLYIPGGKAPLFSTVLMLAVPARVAGCREVILCTPARPDGTIAPEIRHAAWLCGVDRVFAVGGAQAVAAMAYGTESIPRVDKIFGPGNRYVTKAKQLTGANVVAVDLPAGPSEVLVLADDGASPAFAAADLLSQAEHDGDSQAVLVCASMEFALATQRAVEEQLRARRRGEIIREALQQSRIIILNDRDERIAFSNAYAPEHLILSMDEPWEAAAQITDAGSVFIGPWSPESAGDYASGTNHTLPTGGWARSYSGVNIDSFLRKITFQELTREGLAGLAPTIETMAEAEGLDGHAAAVRLRLEASGATSSEAE